jgi:hypothetical protein
MRDQSCSLRHAGIVGLFLAVGRLCVFAGMVLLFINHGRSLASHLIVSVVAVFVGLALVHFGRLISR